jgi:hypothetical protein
MHIKWLKVIDRTDREINKTNPYQALNHEINGLNIKYYLF